MSFHKCYLPSSKDFAKMIIQSGAKSFFEAQSKTNSFLGENDSVLMWTTISLMVKAGKTDSEVLEKLKYQFPTYFS